MKNRVLELNASDERGIDVRFRISFKIQVIREKVILFAQQTVKK